MALTAFESMVCQRLINPVSEMLRKALMGIQKFILGSSNFGCRENSFNFFKFEGTRVISPG